MKEIENLCGVHITAACKRLASEAPAFMVFNGVRVESKVGDTPGDLEAGWHAEMDRLRAKHEAERLAHEQTPEGKRELAAAKTRDDAEKAAAASWRARVEASGIRAKCPWTDEMGEISGFGGGYENACREMVYAGLVWLADRTDVDLSSRETADVKALDAALLAACPDCSGAMHGAAMSAVCFIAKQGWAKYVEAMTRRTSESSTRRSTG